MSRAAKAIFVPFQSGEGVQEPRCTGGDTGIHEGLVVTTGDETATARGGHSLFTTLARKFEATGLPRLLDRPVAWWIAVAFCVVLQVVLILDHDYFIDEWQALQIAVQSPDMAMLLENLTYEGHPPLWHLMLRGLAAVFGPYNTLAIASLICGLTTQFLVLFKSPFPRWARVAIVLSAFLIFEYSTISRSYALGVTLMFLTVALWQRRHWVWLPIVLLPMVDFFFGVFSVMFAWMCWREGNRWAPGVLLWLAAGLFATWTVLPPDDIMTVYGPPMPGVSGLLVWLARLSSMYLPYQGVVEPQWDTSLPIPLAMTLWLPFLWMVWTQTRGRALDRVMVGAYLVMLLAFISFIAPLMNRHTMLAAILLIVLQWRAIEQGHLLRAGFKFWLFLVAVCGLVTSGIALTRPFDTAPQTARFMRERGLSDKHWTVYATQHAQGISAMTGMQFERIGSACMQDVIRWNVRKEFHSATKIVTWLTDYARKHGTFYHIGSVDLPEGPEMRRIIHVAPGFDGKAYYIYRVGDGTREFDRDLPRCVPNMNPLSDTPQI